LCRVGHKTLTQSIKQSQVVNNIDRATSFTALAITIANGWEFQLLSLLTVSVIHSVEFSNEVKCQTHCELYLIYKIF